MQAVLDDTKNFFDILKNTYFIHMYKSAESYDYITYLGDYFSKKGKVLKIEIMIMKGKTSIRVYDFINNTPICVFQKLYSTISDKKALSKSNSLFKFLEKV